MGAVPDVLGQGGERRQHTVDHRADEAGVVEVVPQLVDLRHRQPLGPQGGERVGEVLAVLPAARVRGVGAGRQDGDTAVAVVDHRAQGVGQVGRPVAVAPVDGQVQAVLGEVLAQRVQQFPVLGVDGADAAEQEVVLPHLLEPLAGDAAATGDVLQERDHVVGAFGAAEGQQQQGVIGAGIALFGHAIDPATLPTGAAGRPRRTGPPAPRWASPKTGASGVTAPVSCIGPCHSLPIFGPHRRSTPVAQSLPRHLRPPRHQVVLGRRTAGPDAPVDDGHRHRHDDLPADRPLRPGGRAVRDPRAVRRGHGPADLPAGGPARAEPGAAPGHPGLDRRGRRAAAERATALAGLAAVRLRGLRGLCAERRLDDPGALGGALPGLPARAAHRVLVGVDRRRDRASSSGRSCPSACPPHGSRRPGRCWPPVSWPSGSSG